MKGGKQTKNPIFFFILQCKDNRFFSSSFNSLVMDVSVYFGPEDPNMIFAGDRCIFCVEGIEAF